MSNALHQTNDVSESRRVRNSAECCSKDPRRLLRVNVAIGCALLVILAVILSVIWRAREGVVDYNALTQATEMMTQYVFIHDGQLPSDWNDLRTAYEFVDQAYSLGPSGFEALQQRISINFRRFSEDESTSESKDSRQVLPPTWFIHVRNEQKSALLVEAEKRANERLRQIWSSMPAMDQQRRRP